MGIYSFELFAPRLVQRATRRVFSWIEKLWDWMQPGISWFDSLWEWMTPGMTALAAVAPIAVPIVTLFVAVAALRTFKLRVRVDHAEQWLKRMQEGVQKSLSNDEIEQEYGTHLLATLNAPVKPWLFFNPEIDYRLRARQVTTMLRRLYWWIRLRTTWVMRAFQIFGWTTKWIIFGFPIRQALAAARQRETDRSRSLREAARQEIEVASSEATPSPTFRARLKARKEYRKLRRLTWSVSPAEMEMHAAISERLRKRTLGMEDLDESVSQED